ncbi:MAG TPA: TIR domain-containing protein, partial [Acetobacteraceae bacterium]|nr:TIR domain-containing protein [Acetobacteraceae bacterium]
MKVFLSYGHDANTDLVLRIKRDLEAAGHTPWIDTSEIKHTDDWRRKILDGLKDTDWTLAFLSRHAVRENGVCLDELALAMGMRHGALTTILIEPEAEVRPPVSIGHIQWLDMSDWATRQAADPTAYEAWYRSKLTAILNKLADPETHRFTGEIEELERQLKPIIQSADIPPLIDGFVGREWVVQLVEAWRKTEPQRRMFWLTGGPGAGKSAFAAWITHFLRTNVVGLNLCKWNDEDRYDPRRILRTLAFLIAARLPDYRRRLLDKLHTQDADGAELARKGAVAMFNWLLAEPLALIDGGRRHDRFILVIDALDETLRDGISELADLLAEHAPKLPQWMAVVVTSRPDFPIAASLSHIAPLRLDAEGSAANADDLRIYAHDWLATPDRSATEATALIERVVAAADGNFMYLRKLRDAVEEFGLDLNAPGPLPQGLIGLYRLWFHRQFPDAKAYRAEYAPLIQVLVAAGRPVPVDLLRAMFNWDVPTEARLLQGLGSLFPERADGVAPFHASLRDWLTDRRQSGAEFVVDAALGSRALAVALWSRLLACTDPRVLDDFTIVELPSQLERQTDTTCHGLLTAAAPWPALAERLASVARTLRTQQKGFAWTSALAWLGLIDTLGKLVGDEALPQRYLALGQQGDVHITLGATNAAWTAFQATASVLSLLAKQDPDNADWRHNLSVSHDRLGDVLSAQGDVPGALADYRAGMAIRARLAAADPDNAEWQRELSISHVKLGDVLSALGDLPGALADYRAAMTIRARLTDADPENAEWQRDLSISHVKLGDVFRAQGDLPGALADYRARMAISARLAAADPGNAEWQRDLSVNHERLGDVLSAQGDLPGALADYRAAMVISARLAAADPENAAWQRDLSVSHNKLGDVLRAQGDQPGALADYRAGMAISTRLVAAD